MGGGMQQGACPIFNLLQRSYNTISAWAIGGCSIAVSTTRCGITISSE